MSIEIREIVIHANITEPLNQQQKAEAEPEIRRKALIDECVKRVLQKLAKRPLR